MIGSNGPRMLRATMAHADSWNAWYTDTSNRPAGVAGAPAARGRRLPRGRPRPGRGRADGRGPGPAARRRRPRSRATTAQRRDRAGRRRAGEPSPRRCARSPAKASPTSSSCSTRSPSRASAALLQSSGSSTRASVGRHDFGGPHVQPLRLPPVPSRLPTPEAQVCNVDPGAVPRRRRRHRQSGGHGDHRAPAHVRTVEPARARGRSRPDAGAPCGGGRRHRHGRARATAPACWFRRTTASSGWSPGLSSSLPRSSSAATGLWPDTQAAILLLLAFSGVAFLVVHELLPADALGPAKFLIEGSVAITVVALLVALTGGVREPVLLRFPADRRWRCARRDARSSRSRWRPPQASATSLPSSSARRPAALGAESTAAVAVNLVALILLAYAAMVIAREQRRARDAAIRLSTVDPLTGLFNRTFFFAAIDREIARCARSGRGFCLLMMDLDELKSINDRLGHF